MHSAEGSDFPVMDERRLLDFLEPLRVLEVELVPPLLVPTVKGTMVVSPKLVPPELVSIFELVLFSAPFLSD